jgi:hypothetical protein
LVKPDADSRKKPTKIRSSPLYEQMREQLAGDRGQQLYRRRQAIIEPVFAHTKIPRRADRFQRRGLAACRAEWRLLCRGVGASRGAVVFELAEDGFDDGRALGVELAAVLGGQDAAHEVIEAAAAPGSGCFAAVGVGL